MELNFNLAVFEVENKDSMKQIRAEILEIVEFSGECATQQPGAGNKPFLY